MNFLNNISLKYRLSGVSAVGFILITAVIIIFSQSLYEQRDQDFRSAYLNGLTHLWTAIGDNEKSTMASNFKSLTRNRKLSGALYKGNKKLVLDAVGPTATRLEAMNIVTNLMVLDRQGAIMFSLLDSVSAAPATAKKVFESGKPEMGLELTSDGRLVYLVAFPLLDRADIVGIGIYENSLDSVGAKIKTANGHEVFIRDNAARIQVATSESLPDIDSPQVKTSTYGEQQVGEKILGIGSIPIRDSVSESIIGNLVTVEDVTEAATGMQQLRMTGYLLVPTILILLAIGVWYYMKYSLRPLDGGIQYMERISGGDLSGEINCNRRDEFRRLLNAMQKMKEDLRGLIGKIASTSDELGTMVTQVGSSSENTQQGVEEQRMELDHLATALNELNATSINVAENINHLASAAQETMAATNDGNSLVQKSVQDIGALSEEIRRGSGVVQELEEKSQQIGLVVDVIKNIAEQTNLLALNAAIEAARAGEQGRGFAVVADEVRTLAGRTQESTKEIEGIIGAVQTGVSQAVSVMTESVDHASNAATQAQTIGATLVSVQEQVSRITDLSTQVAAAAEEQRATTEDMNKNVHRISQVADSTATQSSEASSAVEQLSSLSMLLKQETNRFKIS